MACTREGFCGADNSVSNSTEDACGDLEWSGGDLYAMDGRVRDSFLGDQTLALNPSRKGWTATGAEDAIAK